MVKDEDAAKRAAEQADKEGRDVDDAQRKVDGAGKDVDDAKHGVDCLCNFISHGPKRTNTLVT